MSFRNFRVPYDVAEPFQKRVAYFSMEFAIDQPLKIYSGGLGFLAGSHMRSAYELRQNMIGIGILWKYGYYDQGRHTDGTLQPSWIEKTYSFLEDTGIRFQIDVNGAAVWVKALYLAPEVFGTAPLFLLSTDLPENDFLSQTISHRLYDSNAETKVAQYILLGVGGARLIEELGFEPEVYHLNEAHGLSAAFQVYSRLEDKQAVLSRFVFTTHTPEEAGNEKHDIELCHRMGYFCGLSIDEVRSLTGIQDNRFNHSLAALRLSRLANGVSRLHGEVSREMWSRYPGICPIISITNAQNFTYWADKPLYEAREQEDAAAFDRRKRYLKEQAFQIIADHKGKIFSPDVLTMVWARRFASYKRPDFLTQDMERFERLIGRMHYPIQIIWAGKPYPQDQAAIDTFNHLMRLSRSYKNMVVLTGYELSLSRSLKQCADVWLNNPRVPREASGTSGMTAAMNGAVNLSTNDGWIPEFIRPGENGFVVPPADYASMSIEAQDRYDLDALYDLIEKQILPMYYENREGWRGIVQNAMGDVKETFNSNRMAREYYELMYNAAGSDRTNVPSSERVARLEKELCS
jgi:starch phosphorylase